jgi:hypothetical protein
LALHQPFDEVVEGLRRAVRREEDLDNFLEVLPLLDSYFKSIKPYAVLNVDSQFYRAGTRLKVPFYPCAYQLPRPGLFVMKSANMRARDDVALALNWSMNR